MMVEVDKLCSADGEVMFRGAGRGGRERESREGVQKTFFVRHAFPPKPILV